MPSRSNQNFSRSIPLRSVRLYSVPFRPVPSNSVSSRSISFNSMPSRPLEVVLFNSVSFHSIPFHYILYLTSELRKREVIAVVIIHHGQRVELAENDIPPAWITATTKNEIKKKKHARDS